MSVLNVDFEGPLTKEVTALKFASSAGRLAEAQKKLQLLLEKSKEIPFESKNLDETIERTESLYRQQISEGTELLRGCDAKILEVDCEPSINFHEIIKKGKACKKMSILTCTDRRPVERFFKERNIDFYKIASSSELELENGKLTGKFKRYSGGLAKAENYTCGDVIVNSIIDVALCRKANERGFKVYVSESNDGSSVFEETLKSTLEKFHIPYMPFS
jgi:hypothetical protein